MFKAGLAWILLLGCSTLLRAADEQTVSHDFDVLEHRCANEEGRGSSAHEAALDRLDGKRILFVGDTTDRYQYLELAFYLSYGRCPAPGDEKYILNQENFDSYNEFYKVSSQALNVRKSTFRSRELCICARLSLSPREIEEQRTYVYEDLKGRKIELVYEQYFKQAYGRLDTILGASKGLFATDIVVSFGAWQRFTDDTCGAGKGDAEDCPSLDWLCGEFKNQPAGVKIWWFTVPPVSWDGDVVNVIPFEHHLHIPRRCDLSSDHVLDRGALLRTMETDQEKLLQFWPGSNTTDMTPDAYHAFNRQFLGRLTPEQRNRTEPIWFKWLSADDE